MATTTVSARLEEEEVKALEALSDLSGFDRSTLMKTLLRKGIADMNLELATELYRKEEATLSRAAEIAGISQWDFISRMKERNLTLHYDVDDYEKDLEFFGDSN